MILEIPDEKLKKCSCGKPLNEGDTFFIMGIIKDGQPHVGIISSQCMDGYIQEVIHAHEADHQKMAATQGAPDAQKQG